VNKTGCKLCYKPVLGGFNDGERPVCARFADLSSICNNESCCVEQQNPNLSNGNGYYEFNLNCKLNGGGLHCIADSGCRLCYNPVLGGINIGDRPVCERFANVESPVLCGNDECCLNNQRPNPNDGNGFLEFNNDCKVNGGGLHCVADTGCRLCYKPVLGSINVGNRPVCARFAEMEILCGNENCCIDQQRPNPADGNGFLEFNLDCKVNLGGLHCVEESGCRLCYKPVLGGDNVGDRPICARFANLNVGPICNDQDCCLDMQNQNEVDGNGFLEFNNDCKLNGGGLHCVNSTGCRLCYKPILGSTNVGNRPICERFLSISNLCGNEACCVNQQKPNPIDGNGFLEFNNDCKVNGGGLHCVADSGCRLCYKPVLGSENVGNRPTCERFLGLNNLCGNEECCVNQQKPNPFDGNGFLEFNNDCKVNGGGLHCVSDSGCRLCYKPVLGGINVGDRPVCARFLGSDNVCGNQACCEENQNPNPFDGNGYLEFNVDCMNNGGGVHCVSNTGCKLCYKPVNGGVNLGGRPTCVRFLNLEL